jgi:triacylglycerol lipase
MKKVPNTVAPRLNAPIVLVHGLLGFDFLRVGRREVVPYFPGIPEALGTGGTLVHVARMSPTAGIVQRATELKTFLDAKLPGREVHIFAHSMGGLDARYLISRLGMASRVLSLTSIATPHRGSPLADWGMRRVAPLIRPVFDLLRVPWQAFPDLTVESCRAFNEAVPDAPGVRYFSVAGQFQPQWSKWHLNLAGRFIANREGPNDGLVSVASATYGEDCQVWEGDHMEMVNWRNPVPFFRRRNRPDFADRYVSLAQRLADEGF